MQKGVYVLQLEARKGGCLLSIGTVPQVFTGPIGPPTSSSFELTCIYYCKSNSARNLSVIYTRQDGLEWENEAACVDYASHEKETGHDF